MTDHEESQLYQTIAEVAANLEMVDQGRALLANALQDLCRELLDQKAVIALLNESLRDTREHLSNTAKELERVRAALHTHQRSNIQHGR